MGYYNDYSPSMDASRFASAGPSPVTSGSFSEPDGLFKEQRGTFKEAGGMFMPDSSKQQDKAILKAEKRNMPSALNPLTPPVKSTLASLDVGQPFEKRGKLFGADLSLSPRLSDPAFSIERLSGRLGML